MIEVYCAEVISPDEQDSFPGLILSPNLDGSTGPFLESKNPMTMVLSIVSGKQLN